MNYTLNQYPNCPHLSTESKSKICGKLSSIHGVEVHVSPTKCNNICRNGGVFRTHLLEQFIHTAWTSYAMQFGPNFVSKVKASYRDFGRGVKIPTWYGELKEEINVTDAFDCLGGFSLSGSAIYGDLPKKDIDVVVRVSDWEKFTHERGKIFNSLPSYFQDRPIDYFFRSGPSPIFAELDVEKKTLHAPYYFELRDRPIENGILVAVSPDPEKAESAEDASIRWGKFTESIRNKRK